MVLQLERGDAEMIDVSFVAKIIVRVKPWRAQGASTLRVLRLIVVIVVIAELELVVFFII